MKRYTLQFLVSNPAFNLISLHTELEALLLRLHPRITYRLGQMAAVQENRILVEIATDGDKNFLSLHLSRLGDQWPIRLETIGWGWVLSSSPEAASSTSGSELRQKDPFGNLEPVAGSVSFVLNSPFLLWRYILFTILTAALILALIGRWYRYESPILVGLYTIVFPLWLFSLNELSLDPRRYAARITCHPAELEIKYWLKKDIQHLAWDRIWGLEYRYPEYTLYSQAGKFRLVMVERPGQMDKRQILTTLLHRAALNYIDSGVGTALYKRFDAP